MFFRFLKWHLFLNFQMTGLIVHWNHFDKVWSKLPDDSSSFMIYFLEKIFFDSNKTVQQIPEGTYKHCNFRCWFHSF